MTDGEWVPLAAAAVRLGVSVHAVRRRIKSGELTGRRVRSRYGPAWEVRLGDAGTAAQDSREGGASVAPGLREGDEPEPDRLAALVDLVEKLTQQNLELGGRLGFLQAQLQQRDETIRMLEAPKEEPVSAEPIGEPEAASEPAQRPWWRFWERW